jgi:hypothetical protein
MLQVLLVLSWLLLVFKVQWCTIFCCTWELTLVVNMKFTSNIDSGVIFLPHLLCAVTVDDLTTFNKLNIK